MHRLLDDIVARRRESVEGTKGAFPAALSAQYPAAPPTDPAPAMRASGGFLVAEIKRASPSRGTLAPVADAAARARLYERGGARAVSVLCEPDFFRGSRDDVRAAAAAVGVPVLCKDFVLDPVQVHMARADGARWILLIARILGADLVPMMHEALRAGMEPLVEVHTEREMADAASSGARLIGINARDLDTFEVDLAVPLRMAALCPPHCACIAESGIREALDLVDLREAGAHGFLIGEALMRSPEPGALLREFASALKAFSPGALA